MYVYIMRRTQIYLSKAEDAALGRVARTSGRTRSRLIRDAVDRIYLGAADATAVQRALRRSSGAWRRREDGSAYVERLRTGRLARLHRA